MLLGPVIPGSYYFQTLKTVVVGCQFHRLPRFFLCVTLLRKNLLSEFLYLGYVVQ